MDLLTASQCLFHGQLFSARAVVWISKVLKLPSHQDSVWTQVPLLHVHVCIFIYSAFSKLTDFG